MRLFVAVFPPPATRALAVRTIDALRTPNDGVSWVKEDNLHYTMRFIGEVGEDGASRVAQAADEAAAVPAFDAVLGDLGAFPNVRKARVIWVGLASGGDPLRALAERLATSLEKRGWERERQKFQAHLTLGRVREPDRDWGPAFASAPSLSGEPHAQFHVAGLQVVVSQLNPKGSIYTVRHEARLA